MRLVGRDEARAVALAPPLLLAPMEGITEPAFRELVAGLGGLGAACTEFVRIANAALPRRVLARHLGAPLPCPVAVQLMAPGVEHLAATVAAADAAGAAWIDLNFGCPAPVVFDKCAGSALLADPAAVGAITAAAVAATTLPVTAKVRAGIADADRLEDIVRAVADAGAAAITVHGRLRTQGYHQPATWAWIARAVAVRDRVRPGMAVIGNGGVDAPEDVARLRAATGCDAVMIGRAALADPWIFRRAGGGPPATAAEAAAFALAYLDRLEERYGSGTALARGKQLVKWYRAGALFTDAARHALLRVGDLAGLRAGIALTER